MMVSSVFAADQWRNFGHPFPIRSIMPYANGALVATVSGLRYVTHSMDILYSTVHGLGTSSFYALATCVNGYFAVSEYGLVARWDMLYEQWIVYNRSYVSNGVRLIPDMVVGNKDYLVLAFEDRLAFFDTYNRRSLLTIDKIGKNALLATPIQALSIHNDTLYVATGTTLYKRGMDWDHLKDDVRLVDPESWIVEKEDVIIQTIAWKGDSLKIFPTKGQWEWNDDGQLTSVVPDSGIIVIEDEPLNEDILYNEGKTSVFHVAVTNGDTAFLAAENFLTGYDRKKKEIIDYTTTYLPFLLDGTYEMHPLPQGGIIAASPKGYLAYTIDDNWSIPVSVQESGIGNGQEAFNNRMKTLAFLPPDKVLYHIMGFGYYLYSEYGGKLEKVIRPQDKTIFNKYMVNSGNGSMTPMIVTGGVTVSPDSSGFLTTSSTDGGFDLVYISKDGEVSSANHVGKFDFTGPIIASKVDESSDWLVMVSGRESSRAGADGALEYFRVTNPAKNGGRLDVVEHKTVYSDYAETPVDMVYDQKGRYVWLVTKSRLQYWDMDKDSLSVPNSVKGAVSAEYTSVEFDVLGNLWVGTMGQGAYRLVRKGLTQDTLIARQFTMKDGLLNDDVLDLAIDPIRGEAWFSHETGATVYKRSDLRNAELSKKDSANAKIKAYPNPFRLGMHKYITIDNIGPKAVVSIYNRAGHLIRSFADQETSGGSAEWDGMSKNGNLAAPGVYWYVVKKPSGKSEKGKFILIH